MPDVGGYTPAKKKRKNPIRERLSAEKPDPKPEMTKEERERWKKLQSPPRRASAHTLPTYTDEQKRRVAQMRRGVDRGATPKTPTQSEINKRSEAAETARVRRNARWAVNYEKNAQKKSELESIRSEAEKYVTGGEKAKTWGDFNKPEVLRRNSAVWNIAEAIIRNRGMKTFPASRKRKKNGNGGIVDNRGKK